MLVKLLHSVGSIGPSKVQPILAPIYFLSANILYPEGNVWLTSISILVLHFFKCFNAIPKSMVCIFQSILVKGRSIVNLFNWSLAYQQQKGEISTSLKQLFGGKILANPLHSTQDCYKYPLNDTSSFLRHFLERKFLYHPYMSK